MNILVSQAYRTTSTAALCVVAGYPPIDLMVEGRARAHREGKEAKKRIEEEILATWQERWDTNVSTAQWTKTLIPDIRPWLTRGHGEVEYFLTQLLTGHGSFRSYLSRIGKADSENCHYCQDPDNPGHAVFECERWSSSRRETEAAVGEELTPANIIGKMLDRETNWTVIHQFVKRTLARKETEDNGR